VENATQHIAAGQISSLRTSAGSYLFKQYLERLERLRNYISGWEKQEGEG